MPAAYRADRLLSPQQPHQIPQHRQVDQQQPRPEPARPAAPTRTAPTAETRSSASASGTPPTPSPASAPSPSVSASARIRERRKPDLAAADARRSGPPSPSAATRTGPPDRIAAPSPAASPHRPGPCGSGGARRPPRQKKNTAFPSLNSPISSRPLSCMLLRLFDLGGRRRRIHRCLARSRLGTHPDLQLTARLRKCQRRCQPSALSMSASLTPPAFHDAATIAHTSHACDLSRTSFAICQSTLARPA